MTKRISTLAMFTTLALGATALAQPPEGGRRGKLERLDADKDGKVTLAEMKSHGAEKFQKLDANKDGRVTREELDAFREQMRVKFAELRKGREGEDGKRPHGKRWKGKRGMKFGHFFEKLDANGDGAIDASEFDAKMERRFARMDANGDGALEASELRHGRKHWKKHGKRGFGKGGAAGSGGAQ